jgi:HK97 family phage major capsid protein
MVRKGELRRGFGANARTPGYLSPEGARNLAAVVIMGMARKGVLDLLENREALFQEARGVLGIETRASLTTSDIPFPTEYTQELKELVAEFGVARRVMSYYPIGRGTSKPARLGVEDDFGFVAMAATVPEKNITLGNASLESHKVGGIVRYPREIGEQSIVVLGQLLARYGARKFAKAEDLTGFLADGTGTYENIKGVVQVAADSSRLRTLSAGMTSPSDATLEDFRALRGYVKSPVIGTGAYYCHITWERRLRTFKTEADPMIYVQNGPMGRPTLDGYPVIWTEVLQPYTEDAAAAKAIAVFGDLSFWWFGEHGSPRTDLSTDVYFSTDELAVRFIEEIDFDYADDGCASALKTAAV